MKKGGDIIVFEEYLYVIIDNITTILLFFITLKFTYCLNSLIIMN